MSDDLATNPAILSLAESWKAALTENALDNDIAQAPLFGVNLRVDLMKALKASWETAKVGVEIAVASHVVFDPLVWAGIGFESISAVKSVISSVMQKLEPLDYLTYLLLSLSPDGMEKDQLKQQLENFVERPDYKKFSWYLGINDSRVTTAKKSMMEVSWFEDSIKRLSKFHMIEIEGNNLKFLNLNFQVGWHS